MPEKKTLVIIGLLALVLATSPVFFDIYRTAAFNTIPRDDYAPYLLYLVGQGGNMPGAPFAYRIASVAVAIPFYYILPIYAFANLQNIDTPYLRATQALSFSSYLWLVLTPVVIYTIARKQHCATRASSLIVALLTFFLGGFISKVGVDPFAIFIISLLILWLKKPLLFVPLVFVSMGINEKIPVVFATLLTFRLITSGMRRCRFTLFAQLLFSYLAVSGYLAAVFFLKVPGSETYTDPALFLTHLQSSLIFTLSPKGLVLNILPVLILLLIVVLAIRYRQQTSFQVSDVSSLFVLLTLALIADVAYNVGRVVMYSYPLYLPAVSGFIKKVLENGTFST
jgi:hypothetical protein